MNKKSLADELSQACYEGDLELVESILASGADPDGLDSQGRSPLERAAICDRGQVVALLARAGALVDRPDSEGATPLMLACWFGGLDSARALLDSGADPLAFNSNAQAALHLACAEGLSPETRLLLARGGFTELPDALGLSPLDYAIRAASSACARVLAPAWTLAGLRDHWRRWQPLLGPGAEDFLRRSMGASSLSTTGAIAIASGHELALRAIEEPMRTKALALELDESLPKPARCPAASTRV